MKSNTKNTKHGGRRPLKTIYPFHEEWRKTYPSFIERGTSEQLASNKLDSRSSLGYHRTNGKVQQRSRFVGPSHITNRRHAHLVRSSMRAARKYPGVRPIKDLCQAVALQGIGTPSQKNQQATSNQQASRRSSTVGQDTQATDEQAKPSLNRSSSMDPGTSFREP